MSSMSSARSYLSSSRLNPSPSRRWLHSSCLGLGLSSGHGSHFKGSIGLVISSIAKNLSQRIMLWRAYGFTLSHPPAPSTKLTNALKCIRDALRHCSADFRAPTRLGRYLARISGMLFHISVIAREHTENSSHVSIVGGGVDKRVHTNRSAPSMEPSMPATVQWKRSHALWVG
jgi:hypothetical protein